MKKLLLVLVLLIATYSFGQAPTVNLPFLNSATYNQLDIRLQINPNFGVINELTVIYSTESLFGPQFTHEISYPITSISGGSLVNINSLVITCLDEATNYYVKVRATNTAGASTTSVASQFATTAGAGPTGAGLPEVGSFSITNTTTNSATVNLQILVPNLATTSVNVQYATSVPFNNNPTTVTTQDVVTTSANRIINLTGLQSGTTYYVRVLLSNTIGCTRSTIYQFTTNAATTLLYHFDFDNRLTTSPSSPNTGQFSSIDGTHSFVNNGQGNPSGSLFVNCSGSNIDSNKYTANLSALPVGNTSRSIVMRVNFLTYGPNPFNLRHFVVSWGSPAANQSYGFEKIQTQGQSAVWGNTIGIADGTSVPTLNNWVTYVITYDASTRILKYYINGGIRTPANLTHTALNTLGTNIVLGSSLAASFGDSNFNIDDLKIYSGALSDSEITTILSNDDFKVNNLKFSMYPNPANNLLNIDIQSDIQSVEVYSLQGQKVLSSFDKQIDISGLSSGMYMVRVQDVNGGVGTQKLIKN